MAPKFVTGDIQTAGESLEYCEKCNSHHEKGKCVKSESDNEGGNNGEEKEEGDISE